MLGARSDHATVPGTPRRKEGRKEGRQAGRQAGRKAGELPIHTIQLLPLACIQALT